MSPISKNVPTVSSTPKPAVQNIIVDNRSATDPIINREGEINMFPKPDGLTLSIASAAGGGALSKTCYFLNEDKYNATPTDNGSGAGSIVATYGDGWSGKGYNAYANALTAMGQNGIKVYGFTIHYTTTAGAESPSGLSTANVTWLMANLVGANMVPVGFVMNSGARNTQYLSGEMTVKGVFYLSSMNQISFVVAAGINCNLTILTNPF